MRRSGRGDEAAFAQLYDATASRVYGLAVRVVRDPAQAEEVTQEALLEIWRTAGRYDSDKGSPLGLVAHHHPPQGRRPGPLGRGVHAAGPTYHHKHHSVEHDTTAEAVQSSFEAHRVRTAMGALTDVQREAIGLAYFGGYTHTEVATMLDLPVGTAKTRIRDGLIRLRDAMGVGS